MVPGDHADLLLHIQRVRRRSRPADRLTGIKKLERNDSVTGQLIMWAELLGRGGDLFTPTYPHLSFGRLPTFEIDAGIDDDAWRTHEEDHVESPDDDTMQLELFVP